MSYDSWLERPYQDDYERQDFEEWVDENTTFTTDCDCRGKVDAVTAWYVKDNGGSVVMCAECRHITTFTAHPPEVVDNTPDWGDDYRDELEFDFLD